MKISIAMATYNGAKYINEQLQSFLDQTRQPDELVVSDDCSTDNTQEIVEEFAKTAPFEVRFFRNQQNLGYAGNFNAALMQTTGELVFLSDQDDIWFPEKLEYVSAVARENPSFLLFMNDAMLTDENFKFVGTTKLGQIRSIGNPDEKFVSGCCCAIMRELLNICLPLPSKIKQHDTWIVNFADGLKSKLIIEKSLQFYRRHENTETKHVTSRTVKATKFSYFIELFRSVTKPESEIEEFENISQKKMLLEGIARSQSRDDGRFTLQLQSMAYENRADIEMMEKRMAIRSKSLPSRIAESFSYWRVGGYRRARGFQSVVRDVVGNYFKNNTFIL